jgi:membrane associated rhomboid family serine protease
MSWRDRPYPYDDVGGYASRGGMGLGLPRPTRLVTILLIVNFVVFFLAAVSRTLMDMLYGLGEMRVGINGSPGVFTGQVWRLVTYQYLHSMEGPFHLLFNMLGLYFFGPPLEARWGPRRLFAFYTACGVAGAILFVALVVVGVVGDARMIGASGCVLGLLAGCAVLMPQMTIILLFFPVPIRMAAALLVFVYLLNILTALANPIRGAGADAAHLGGMLFGALWCWRGLRLGSSPGWIRNFQQRRERSTWQREMQRQQALQAEVDRILAKVHDQGIQSLTRREKRALAEATARQREQDNRVRRL